MKKFFTLFVALAFGFGLYAQNVGTTYTPVVTQAAFHDVSKPLTEMAVQPLGAEYHHQWKGKVVENKFEDKHLKKTSGALPIGEDPLWQKEPGSKALTSPIQNFEGTRNSDNSSGLSPPDVQGDVGPNHYFQMCNVIFQIFDKNGTTLMGPLDNSTIWSGFIGPWTGSNDGDPIVLYDEQADRWLVSQFAVNTTNGTYWELVAISTTPDPTGSYYRYAFQFTSFPDYPKLGIWRDGYYIMVQHGTSAGDVTAAALERSQMLIGGTADMVSFPMPNLPGGGFIGMLPSDNDGPWAPVGTPCYFMYFSDDAWGDDPVDRLKIWEFDVNWTTPASSTLTLTQNLNTTSFDSYFSTFNAPNVGQPGTTQGLATLEGALMHRLQYRNFGSYETMVLCHTVDIDNAPTAGIRWYELRKPSGGSWSIHQEGTYSPGTDHYWMASIAMNGDGDIALGYSVSSETTYPSIRYTGRFADDPLGVMTFAEQSIIEGTNYQNGTTRWGDYTAMTVDPVDDETFWYTNEYLGGNGWSDWVTQIASFSISEYCTAMSATCDEYIANVSIGSINNSSGCDNYRDYTALSTDIPVNFPQNITVTNGMTIYTSDQCGIWVDWNRDGDFYDVDEAISVSGTPGAGPYSATIAVPAGVTTGECTMRIRITYTGIVDPCGTTTYGEVEDYTINVAPAVPNTWTGAFNSFWHNDANWTLGHIPTVGEDVLLTTAGSQPIKLDFYNESCDNLTINSGVSFEIYGYALNASGTIDNNGTIKFLNAASTVNAGGLTNTGGTVMMANGSFSVAELTDNGVYGTWVQNGGLIELNQTIGYPDINGTITINNGNFTVSDPGSSCYWGFGAAANVTMTGGVLDIISSGIYISSAYTISEGISGGTIRTPGNLSITNSSFTPTGGTFELYGPNDASISQTAGNIYILNINKGVAKSSALIPEITTDRFENIIKAPLANSAYPSSDLDILGSLLINSGEFYPNGHTLNITQNCLVYGGSLLLNSPADVLNIGTTTGHWLWFYSGASGNFSDGQVNLFYGLELDPGCSFNTTAPNEINFMSTASIYGVLGYEPAAISTINMTNASGTGYLEECVDLTIDNLNIGANTFVYAFGGSNLTINNFTDASGSSFVHDGSAKSPQTGLTGGGGLISGQNGGSPDALPVTTINNDVLVNGLFDVGISTVTAHGKFETASTGELAVSGGSFLCDFTLSSGWNILNGLTTLSSGSISFVDANLQVANTNISGGILEAGRTILANTPGGFTPSGGTVSLVGSSSSHYISVNATNGNYFNNLEVNNTGYIGFYAGTPVQINGNFSINSGSIGGNNNTITVGGNWDNNVGNTGYLPQSSTIVFKSSNTIQYVYGENTFYNVQQDYMAPGSNLQFIDPTLVTNNMVLNHFTWINNQFEVQGVLDLSNASSKFTANNGGNGTIASLVQGGTVVANGGDVDFLDVAEEGLFGTVAVVNGNLNYFQDATQFPDINATVDISGGSLNVNGGIGGCVWGYSSPASVTMSGGTFSISGNPVSIADPFTENITGGTILLDNGFSGSSTSFTPAGGEIRLIGGTDGNLSHAAGANFFNVVIDKTGGKSAPVTYKDRDGNLVEAIMANTASFTSEVTILGNLSVETGTLSCNGYAVHVSGDVNVNDGGLLNLPAGSVLGLDDPSVVNVNNNGSIDITSATVTRNTSGYYSFNVNNGGNIAAVSSIFEYMDIIGVNLLPGSIVNNGSSFDNCTFREGQAGGGSSLMTLNGEHYFTANNVVFPTNTWGSDYNVWKSDNLGGVNFVNASGGFDGETFEYDPNNRVGWTDGNLDMNIMVMLEGPYDSGTGLMKTDLLSSGYIPLNQPFNPVLPYYDNAAPKWLYSGTESVGSIPANTVDWVLVQLRDAATAADASSGTILDSKAGFLLNNGQIVDLDGVSPLQFTGATFSTNLYVVIYQRNHLGIISNYPLIESGGSFNYDFSTSVDQAYGGANGHKQIDSGTWGMISADGNANGLIQNTDETAVWKTDLGSSGYTGGDFNLNGLTQNTDETNYWKVNLGGGGQVPAKANSGYQSQIPK